jgi:hypothetical protein
MGKASPLCREIVLIPRHPILFWLFCLIIPVDDDPQDILFRHTKKYIVNLSQVGLPTFSISRNFDEVSTSVYVRRCKFSDHVSQISARCTNSIAKISIIVLLFVSSRSGNHLDLLVLSKSSFALSAMSSLMKQIMQSLDRFPLKLQRKLIVEANE